MIKCKNNVFESWDRHLEPIMANIVLSLCVSSCLLYLYLSLTLPCRSDNEGLSLSSPYRQLYWAYLGVVNARLLLLPSPLLHDYRMNAIPLVKSPTDARHLLTLAAMATLVLLFKRAHYSSSFNTEHGIETPQHPCPHNMASEMNSTSACLRDPLDHSDFTVISHGLLLLVIPFLPASNLFFPVGFVVAERVLYLPSMGFCLLVAYSAHKLVKSRHKYISSCVRVLLMLLFVTHCAKSVIRNQDWESKFTLYRSVIHHYPTNGFAISNIGRELKKAGHLERAERVYRYGIRVSPMVIALYVNLASLMQSQNRGIDAEQVREGV